MTSPPPRSISRPRLIATDLDGTYLSSDGSVSAENAAAVLAAQQAGIPVVFATGRPIRWLDVIRDLPGAHPMVIVSNGAALYDLGTKEMVDRVFVSPDVALSAIAELRASIPGTTFAVESGLRFGYEPDYKMLTDNDTLTDPALFSGPVEEIVNDGDFVKLLVQNNTLAADELLVGVKKIVQDRLTVTHSASSGRGLVEISAPGVSKASMLQRYCARLEIEAGEVAAFGDMPNDIEMLTWVGMPHVVANAHPALLEMDLTVVGTNDESGVGRTIQGWLS